MDKNFEERAKEIIKELLNPEPHPFQEEWSDAHSMTSEKLIERLAEALRQVSDEADKKGFLRGVEDSAKVQDEIAQAIRKLAEDGK